MIDFHTHILPGIDDGSKDIAMTEEMLRREAAMGVTKDKGLCHSAFLCL